MGEGGKYEGLYEYLFFSGKECLSMTFPEIEAVIGGRLPPSARSRAEWWSNSASGHSQARAWMRASYRTSNINLARERVDFTLKEWPEGVADARLIRFPGETLAKVTGMAEVAQSPYDAGQQDQTSAGSPPVHPLFGIWKGKVTLLPGHDYTLPALDPDEMP